MYTLRQDYNLDLPAAGQGLYAQLLTMLPLPFTDLQTPVNVGHLYAEGTPPLPQPILWHATRD